MGKLFDIYIKSHCLTNENAAEFFDCIGDLYYSDEVQSLKKFPQHSTIDRLDHITSVSYMSYVYAKKYNMDFRRVARAAILHDLYYYDWHDKARWHRPHGYKHPRFAVNNAKKLYPEISDFEENIILRHMWPLTVIPPATKAGYLVSFADKYCAARELLRADCKHFTKQFEQSINIFKEKEKC